MKNYVDVSENLVVAKVLYIDFASQKTGSPKHRKMRSRKQNISTEGKDWNICEYDFSFIHQLTWITCLGYVTLQLLGQ
jgi:hypothetical protein